jgi:hypothetical protein
MTSMCTPLAAAVCWSFWVWCPTRGNVVVCGIPWRRCWRSRPRRCWRGPAQSGPLGNGRLRRLRWCWRRWEHGMTRSLAGSGLRMSTPSGGCCAWWTPARSIGPWACSWPNAPVSARWTPRRARSATQPRTDPGNQARTTTTPSPASHPAQRGTSRSRGDCQWMARPCAGRSSLTGVRCTCWRRWPMRSPPCSPSATWRTKQTRSRSSNRFWIRWSSPGGRSLSMPARPAGHRTLPGGRQRRGIRVHRHQRC